MTWEDRNGEWILRDADGKLLGSVYRVQDGWCAETELLGLTTSPGTLEWAQAELWNFCTRAYSPTRIHVSQ